MTSVALFFLQNFAVELYTLYKEQDGDIDKLFTELTDDDVTAIRLRARVFYEQIVNEAQPR